MTMTVATVAELTALTGTHLGYSSWREVTQQQVNTFADATDDHQWIHVDAERAAAGPFGTTIARIPHAVAARADVERDPAFRRRPPRHQLRIEQGAIPFAGAGRVEDSHG